jgi:hypothetical protein
VIVVADLPLGPAVKGRWGGLAAALGLAVVIGGEVGGAPFAAPQGEIEALAAGIWRVVLGVNGVGVGDDFQALGGDSILATQVAVAARLRRRLALDLTVASFFDAPTVAAMARVVEGLLLREVDPSVGTEAPKAAS